MNNHPYRINVGFLINAPVGTYRDFTIDEPAMELDDDLHAEKIHCDVRASKVQQGILATVDCSGNSLSTIDLSDRKLYSFDCSNNKLSALDLASARVELLYCFGNSISSLVINRDDNETKCCCFISPGTKVTVQTGEAKIVYVSEN